MNPTPHTDLWNYSHNVNNSKKKLCLFAWSLVSDEHFTCCRFIFRNSLVHLIRPFLEITTERRWQWTIKMKYHYQWFKQDAPFFPEKSACITFSGDNDCVFKTPTRRCSLLPRGILISQTGSYVWDIIKICPVNRTNTRMNIISLHKEKK